MSRRKDGRPRTLVQGAPSHRDDEARAAEPGARRENGAIETAPVDPAE